MTEQAVVYIVTYGSYSDYSISSVWTTREAAEREAATHGDSGVEAFILNDREHVPNMLWRAYTELGGAIKVDDKPWDSERADPPHVYWNKVYKFWAGNADGPSPEHARKNLSDAIAKAKGEALEPVPADKREV